MQVDTEASSKQTDTDKERLLELLAPQIAENHTLDNFPEQKTLLLGHLPGWKQTLQDAYQWFRAAPSKDPAFLVASEWLLDNYYVVEQAFRQIDEDMSESYYRQLPKLATPALRGYPRIFAVAWELVGGCQSQIDLAQVAAFVQSYQQATPLTIGELWALPIMLRIGIVERLTAAVLAITGMEVVESPKTFPFLPPSPKVTDDTIVANSIVSLRLLSVNNWKSFFEEISRVEQTLRGDPAGIYGNMDFDSRNRYRRVIEELARDSNQDEETIAQEAIELAQVVRGKFQNLPQEGQNQNLHIDRKTHVGFYLIDVGRSQLESCLDYRPKWGTRLRHWFLEHPTSTYLVSISLFFLLILTGLLNYTSTTGGSVIQIIIVGLLGSIPVMTVAISLVHWVITHKMPPHTLPRMDFSEGIPAKCRTMVVIPTLLTNINEADSLLQELELHFLRNDDPHLSFALLSDFGDAPAQHTSEDEQLLARAKAGIEALNSKYAKVAPFYLFHRDRQWNPSEGVWMGWERKRGKLMELNRLLMNAGQTSYSLQVGNLSILHDIKYVITLDADTILPQGSANQLIATLAHPLNRAEFDVDGRSVIAGYTVLQPRVEIKPTSANSSLFTRIFAGNVGLDLYTLAVSDVYQDFFGEGSYVGKGIYDVEAFEKSLAGQVGENTLLSHDLFEGIYGRAALVTDITLFEEYPTQYLTYAQRLRRWIRGDWQLLPWLLPFVQTAKGIAANPLAIIDRWKIFDNLRRSLIPLTLLILLAIAWLWLPGSPLVWTVLVLLTPAIPTAAQTIIRAGQNMVQQSLRGMIQPSKLQALRWVLAIIFLPYEALLSLDAIWITLIRLFIARKNLLQWTTAAHIARLSGINARYKTWLQMTASLAFISIVGLATFLINPVALPVAAPLLAVWLISPQVAFWISQPTIRAPAPLSEAQRRQLRGLARRTWEFFEQMVGPDDHWLPPDHFQKSPRGIIAHQTSPTNIGMLLLSTLTAYDLGYIGLLELAVRLRSTFDNLDKLERYRGHFLNWYDTRTLEPLSQRYVSTVDSGNLAACLIALKQGCLTITNAPLMGKQQWQGLLDILEIITNALKNLNGKGPDSAITPFEVELNSICERIIANQDKPGQWISILSWLSVEGWEKISRRMMRLLESQLSNQDIEPLSELRLYLERMRHHLTSIQLNIDIVAPWLSSFTKPPKLFAEMGSPSAQAWQVFRDAIPTDIPNLGEATSVFDKITAHLAQLQANLNDNSGPAEQIQEARAWCQKLNENLASSRLRVHALQIGYHDLAMQAEAYTNAMDFKFLFDERRQVFHIGYNATTEKLDANYYDLLASEARIASLIAIAKHDVPQSHWLHLGRPVTKVNGEQVLLSWSGTMFEYLMPALLMRIYEGTFLWDSCYTAVDSQISYGQQKHIPWGISESGYYDFDANMNYQYRAFGVPKLGFKRDLSEDLVVSPYASLIGLSLQPQAVMNNIMHFYDLKMLGPYGFYEAVDFTQTRLPSGQHSAIVQSYMTHHQGMILLAICNYLLDDTMIRRFHVDEHIQSVELLLQEKIPQNAQFAYPHQEDVAITLPTTPSVSILPWRVPADSPVPQAHFLSQGQLGVLITSAGSGYSQWQDIALTRWQADTTLDNWGTWFYVQDRDSGALWSATYQPTGSSPENQEILFHPHKVEFRRWDNDISLHMEITVGADEIEIRRITLLNDSDRPRRLKLTSYSEIVLTTQPTDQRHPAFNKLFIESEYIPEVNALMFRRRPRSPKEKIIYLMHSLVVDPRHRVTGEYESDRGRFLGRGQTSRSPIALQGNDRKLAGTVGTTLDPIMSLTQEIDLEPHAKTQITYLTLVAQSRQEALALVNRYQSRQVINQAFEAARARSETELKNLGLNAVGVKHIQQLLSVLLYPTDRLRSVPESVARNDKGLPGLWAYGISGDYPILLVRVHEADTPLVLEALQAFTYWRNRQIKINLVILNQQDTSYALDLHNNLYRQIVRMDANAWLNQRDGIFLLQADQIPEADKALLERVAGAILDNQTGSLAEHLGRLMEKRTRLPVFTPALPAAEDPESTPILARPTGLLIDNGLGGFDPDEDEYVIYLQPGQWTPHPWINVIANPYFGFLVSEAGSGCTWAGNSSENRLTPWRNDPVTDQPGEALYLRDEETALVWSPTPLPTGAEAPYLIRHGAGYSIFEHQSHGLKQRLRLFTAPDAPVKIAHLRLENMWTRPRRITVTYYAEWVLGTMRETNQQYIVPEFDPDSQALLAYNRYNTEFKEHVAFLAGNKKLHGLTADRTEFLGRMGSMRHPAAIGRMGLASTVRGGLDPCAAIQLHVDLAPGQAEDVFFLIGEGSNREESLALIRQYQDPGQIEAAWQDNHSLWDNMLNSITVQTPDLAMNLILNRWLLYQTISCRLWGRSALYQSSGAYGFRDQLQDGMAILHARPDIAREQILRAAHHQFEAGDVLHWWHPPSERGVRTRFSDDLLWLPFVTAHYVLTTGDKTILSEQIPFLRGEPLKVDEDERFSQFEPTTQVYTLFEHCRRAIEKGSTVGSHGLPLIGSGDWNDGMNRVGVEGRGESVWLGWFLHATLIDFASLCDLMNTDPEPYRQRAKRLLQAIEANAWDGNWYRRAYYDDGKPMGSSQNKECQIDSIAQSWAVQSGAGDPGRAAQAMEAVNKHLVKRDDRLILLFTPPFDKTARDPGYIKGYSPGIRENGGQYTHAAIWAGWAFAALGQGDRAEELFRLLNPVYHADTPEKVNRYQVEPYVIAGDIYSVAPHTGNGGWTWYSGSSGWMYRLGIEAILGVRRLGNSLQINPCIPKHWPGFELTYRSSTVVYHIYVDNPNGVNRGVVQVSVDGKVLPDNNIPLSVDGQKHVVVHVLMGHVG